MERAAIARRAATEAAVRSAVIDARVVRDAAAKEVDARKALLDALEAKDLADLPDEDAAIRAHLTAIEVGKTRMKIAEKKLADADAAVAQAQAALDADRSVTAPEFEKTSRDRERIAEHFDEEFPAHAEGLIELIELALQANPTKEKTGVGRVVQAARGLLGGRTTLRIELVDKTGAVLWRGDQTTTSSVDSAR